MVLKLGFTNGANRCLVTSCKRGNLDIICVVLGCDTKKDRTLDSIKLIDWTFKNFSLVNVKDIILNDFNNWELSHKNSFFVNKGFSNNFNLYLNNSDFLFSSIAVNNSLLKNIETEISFNSYFEAPVASDTEIGRITLKINDNNLFSVRILNSNLIRKKNCFNYIIYFLKNYCNFFYDSI